MRRTRPDAHSCRANSLPRNSAFLTMASNFIFPADEAELCEAIMSAATKRERLAIHGGSSKRDVGRLVDATRLDMSKFTGIVDYDPHELVLTARAGTPLADIQDRKSTRL